MIVPARVRPPRVDLHLAVDEELPHVLRRLRPPHPTPPRRRFPAGDVDRAVNHGTLRRRGGDDDRARFGAPLPAESESLRANDPNPSARPS